MAIALAMIFHCHWSIRPNLGNESLITNAHLSKLISWANVSTAEILTNTIHIYHNAVLLIGLDQLHEIGLHACLPSWYRNQTRKARKHASPWNKNILLYQVSSEKPFMFVYCVNILLILICMMLIQHKVVLLVLTSKIN